jgi:hypothetical protein
MKPSDANVTLIMPDETTREINMLRMLVHTQNAEFKSKHDMFLPGVNKLRPTVKDLRDEYGIPARTWDQAAEQMRRMYGDIQAHIAAQHVVVDAPDVSPCCGAATSVDENAVVYCKACYEAI